MAEAELTAERGQEHAPHQCALAGAAHSGDHVEATDRELEIDLLHDPDGGRIALVRPVGQRWSAVDLTDLTEVAAPDVAREALRA